MIQVVACVRCLSAHLGHKLIDAEEHFFHIQQVIQPAQSLYTQKEINSMKDQARWAVMKRSVTTITRSASLQMDSMSRTLKNARAVRKEVWCGS